jgi:hypothetical protein
VDSQDILNVPDIDFGTFQMFPDQYNYGTTRPVTEVQPPSSNFDSTMNDTVTWIRAQINCAHTWGFLLTTGTHDLKSAFDSIGKPIVLSAFGLVTQDNLLNFVPVNDTSPVVKPPKQKRKSFCTTALVGICLEKTSTHCSFQDRMLGLGHSAQVSIRNRLTPRTQHGYKVCAYFTTKPTKRRLLMTMPLQLVSRVVLVDWLNTRLVAHLTTSSSTMTNTTLVGSYSGLRKTYCPKMELLYRVRMHSEHLVLRPTTAMAFLGTSVTNYPLS